jgi:starch synthase
MVATENGALPGAKVGGIADVIGSLAPAMARRGMAVSVVTPGYGVLSSLPGFTPCGTVVTSFGGRRVEASVYNRTDGVVGHFVIEHPHLTTSIPGQIYVNDDAGTPFATDATRFALFSALMCSWLLERPDDEVVHLHDWHAATVAILREFDPAYAALKARPLVYTIHNLALQGIRPLRGHESALFEWFPTLVADDRVTDPRWQDCVNLMRAGILLADRVNTVSPGYAREIVEANDEANGRHGGEGLEADLQALDAAGRLHGILNGCEYPEPLPGTRYSLTELLPTIKNTVLQLASAEHYMPSSHVIALDTIANMDPLHHRVIVTGISRLTDQKTALLEIDLDGQPVLFRLLQHMGEDGVLILLGNGDARIERFLTMAAARYPSLVFLAGFSATVADNLYRSGDLFIMPSTFEPCGIGQMLAMRAGQPCVVHATGGLKDTVVDGKTGWTFDGETTVIQARNFLARFINAFDGAKAGTKRFVKIGEAAAKVRFTWDTAAGQYISLYDDE